jgi:hypothetical protein
MSKAPVHTMASRKVVESENAKMARLREQRMASDAAKRAAGTSATCRHRDPHEHRQVFVLLKGWAPGSAPRRIRAPPPSTSMSGCRLAVDQPEDFLKQT